MPSSALRLFGIFLATFLAFFFLSLALIIRIFCAEPLHGTEDKSLVALKDVQPLKKSNGSPKLLIEPIREIFPMVGTPGILTLGRYRKTLAWTAPPGAGGGGRK